MIIYGAFYPREERFPIESIIQQFRCLPCHPVFAILMCFLVISWSNKLLSVSLAVGVGQDVAEYARWIGIKYRVSPKDHRIRGKVECKPNVQYQISDRNSPFLVCRAESVFSV